MPAADRPQRLGSPEQRRRKAAAIRYAKRNSKAQRGIDRRTRKSAPGPTELFGPDKRSGGWQSVKQA